MFRLYKVSFITAAFITLHAYYTPILYKFYFIVGLKKLKSQCFLHQSIALSISAFVKSGHIFSEKYIVE